MGLKSQDGSLQAMTIMSTGSAMTLGGLCLQFPLSEPTRLPLQVRCQVQFNLQALQSKKFGPMSLRIDSSRLTAAGLWGFGNPASHEVPLPAHSQVSERSLLWPLKMA